MSVVTLTKAKNHLNIVGDAKDAKVQSFIDRAEKAIVRRTGPLVATPVTKRVRGGSQLVLSVYPILSITSVTPVGGVALTVGDLVPLDGGLIGYASGSGAFRSSTGYDVVYVAGWAADADSLPEDLELAVLELVRHFWDTQRGGEGRTRGGSEQLPAGPGFTYPHRVEELLAPFVLPAFS